jgi:hypothetical protein
MRTVPLSLFVAIVVPTLAAAQSSSAKPSPTEGFSTEGRVKAEATLQAAHDQGLPEQALITVMLEGQAKAATEAQILAAEQQTFARLEASQQAIAAAGRTPSDAEVTLGANLLAQGATSAQLTAIVAGTPSDVSLVTSLNASGAQAQGSSLSSSATAGAAATTDASLDAGSSSSFTGLGAAGSANTAVSAGILHR